MPNEKFSIFLTIAKQLNQKEITPLLMGAVGFGIMDTLPDFAGISLEELELHQQGGATYYLLTSEQYLKVYEASFKGSYRANKNNQKDKKKIAYLRDLI